MSEPAFQPLSLTYQEIPTEEMLCRSENFSLEMQRRRTVRHFSNRSVPKQVIINCLQAACSAPSGANLQPWQFVMVTDLEIKRQIRQAAEAEEREFYKRRATTQWLDDLAVLGTSPEKPFLEIAPCLIAIFSQVNRILPGGEKAKNYYVQESVGIAVGMLIAALHHAGLVTLTHTPSPMNFLSQILERPANEKPFLLLVVGYPARDATVPAITRKPFEDQVTVR